MPSIRYQKIDAHHYRHVWTVGDIHGDCQLLQSRLHQLSFCPETDLLISVGDNIDRGPRSLNMLHLLNQPRFIFVKGNHGAMTFDAFGTGDGNIWLTSGDDWFFDLNGSEQQEAIDLSLKFHHLPRIVETTNDTIKYIVIHADYPGKEYQLGREVAENESLWPIDRVQKSLNSESQKINGADFFIFDHVMSDNIQTFANQIYMDTGSSKSGQLSFYKVKQSHASSMKRK